jgi:AbrB family looped-hinge helix DNA binding protein
VRSGGFRLNLRCHSIWHMASSPGVRLTIDKAGRIVIPKGLRERFGLKAGTELEIVDQPGGMFLRTVEKEPVALMKLDGFWVHQGVAQPDANWDRVIQEVREERIESTSGRAAASEQGHPHHGEALLTS